ncbi:MAG: triose-phosphate isomerase [Acidimicrobiia bacterium]|nr:triose-phosphate isomerase [Acidimicrobiia bacterium]
MDRKKLIAGNWKMNTNHLEGIQMVQKLSYRLEREDYDRVDVLVCPPFTSLRSIQTVIGADKMMIGLGAQNVDWHESGAYTGEISAEMLAKLEVAYVIVGHSERRQYFGETDETVNKRAKAVIAAGMMPIVCVGETEAEYDEGRTMDVVLSQVSGGLAGNDPEAVAGLVMAYEPVWAIGTGKACSPDRANEVCEAIRNRIGDEFGSDAAESVRIQYGGSVNPGNVKELMAKRHIDGALVGGASLDPDQFAAVVRYWV